MKADGVKTKQLNLSETVKTFLAGGIAGCCAKTAVAPLDRVKILLQAHNQHFKHLDDMVAKESLITYPALCLAEKNGAAFMKADNFVNVVSTLLSVFSSLNQVLLKEGLIGLFRGNGIQMLRIFPYAAIQYSTFEHYKRVLKPLFSKHPHFIKLASGSLAGLTAVLLTYPLDVVRARVAFQVRGHSVEAGMVETMRAMLYVEGGIRTFYRGIIPTMLGMAPYSGLSFYTFETMKNFALEKFPDTLGKPCPQNTGGLVLIVPAKLMCGGLAGAAAQTVSYPLDVVRRRLQLSSMLPEPHRYERQRWFETLAMVYKDDGVAKGLFRGMSVNYIRIMPMVGVSFTVYESMKQALGLDTGMDR